MSLKFKMVALFSAFMATQAVAADVPMVSTGVKGVWSTADGCHRLKLSKINPNALWKDGYEDTTYLDSRGINGYEWNCRFTKGFEGDGVYLSSCELEGEPWTDILKVERISTGGWTVTALDGANEPNVITFDTMCRASK